MMAEVFEYMIGDQFNSALEIWNSITNTLKIIQHDHGENCKIDPGTRDTMMEAIEPMDPPRRRSIFFLHVTPADGI